MFATLVLAAAVAAAPGDCAALTAQARSAIDHANADWIRAMRAGDAAAIAAAYADDGLFVLPDGAVAKGRAAVVALYARQAGSASQISGGGIESLGTACGDGGLVYEWGRGSVRVKAADGHEIERGGPYLTVWKNVGGAWKIVRNLAF
jgi:ketosteroid isomerase-like protein